DLPAGGGGAGHAVGCRGAAGQGAAQVGGELGVEDAGVAVVRTLAEIGGGDVLAAAEGQGGRGPAGAAVGEGGAVRQGEVHLVDAGAGPQADGGGPGGG